MAVSSRKSFFAFLLLTSLGTLTFGQNGLISDVCNQARNPSLCSMSLKSDPRSSKADLPTFALIGIEKSQANVKSTLNLIKSLEKPITSLAIRQVYEACLENYNDALDGLESAKKFLRARDFRSLNSYAFAIVTDPDTCDQGFEDIAIHEPPKLMIASHELKDFADVILVISKKLAGES